MAELSESVSAQLERLGDSYATGESKFGPSVSNAVVAAAAMYEAAEIVRRHEQTSAFAPLVEGLHAQIFGVHALNDPALSHAALSDNGAIHEAAHALVRALPARSGEHGNSER